MALSPEFPGSALVGQSAERAFRLPMGAVSPLWAVFGAAAGVGVAYWWMTSWTRLVNVEALGGFAKTPANALLEAAPLEIVSEPAPAAVEAVEESEAIAEPVVAAPVEIAEAVVEAAEDDLTRMTGIGPKLSLALAARGVTTFAQIAAWTAADLAEADGALALKGRAVREAWVAQAKRLANA